MLKSIELVGFKSFGRKTRMDFDAPVTAIVGPNGSGKSNAAEAFRFALGEQSMKSLRGKRGEDLLFNGSGHAPRANRASVKVVLDNSSKLLDMDFPEVVIERVVHRDSNHEYFINGSPARLKDITALLSNANIGSTGHHMISQGEADRVLGVNPIERRAMIEDALGLKVYHLKKKDALQKIKKTEDNLEDIKNLKRELAPRLNFLTGQMKKIEESRKIEEELIETYKKYFGIEKAVISFHKARITDESERKKQRLEELREVVEQGEPEQVSQKDDGEVQSYHAAIQEIEENLQEVRVRRGRKEGELSVLTRQSNKTSHAPTTVSFERVQTFLNSLKELFGAEDSKLREKLRELVSTFEASEFREEGEKEEEQNVESEVSELEREIKKLEEESEKLIRDLEVLREKQREEDRKQHEQRAEQEEGRREYISAVREQERLLGEIKDLSHQGESLGEREMRFKEEQAQAGILLSRAVLDFETVSLEGSVVQEVERKVEGLRSQILRLRVRLEENGIGDVRATEREYEDVEERVKFLEGEMQDLEGTRNSLHELIAELDHKLHDEFLLGMKRINDAFEHFFVKMFGGGNAGICVEKRKLEEGESENDRGVEVEVELPRKRVKGLHMLSGGERALTSIALLFAMSRVNPPPFIILDETDAALDEANSRRYGDMIEELARESQLILITHNRETMSRAGVLYGVTMGRDSVSQLLSIKFEQALEVAKT